jgi:hypothetical protein
MIDTILTLVILACPAQGEPINPNAIYMCAEKAQPKQKELLPCVDNPDPDKFYNCATKIIREPKPYKWVKVKSKWIKVNK